MDSFFILEFRSPIDLADMNTGLSALGSRVLHRLSPTTVVIQSSLSSETLDTALPPYITRKVDVRTRSSTIESGGLLEDAIRLSESIEFQELKTQRTDDDLEWGQGSLAAPGIDEAESARSRALFNFPSNERLINDVTVCLIVVDGANEFSMSPEERVNIAAEVQTGLTWLGTQESRANVSWTYDVQTVEVNITPWQGARWPGMPGEFYEGIDAALVRKDNGKLYMFKGSKYVRFSSVAAGADAGYPKPIQGNWPGLPEAFTHGIDAALWAKHNDKLYFFKGSKYIRMSNISQGVDDGYPKNISVGWPGLPDRFKAGIDAAFVRKDNGRLYMFKGPDYVRFTRVSDGVDDGYPKPIAGNWPGLPETYRDGINAALWRDSNSKIYFFKNKRVNHKLYGTYVRFTDVSDGVDDAYRNGLPIGLSSEEAEALWRDPAMAVLGYGSGIDEVRHRVADVRSSLGSSSGFCIFATKYPTTHFAYASRGRLVIRYSDFSVGAHSNMDRIVAHETGHIFGAPDEYASSNCSCAGTGGRFFSHANSNCANCLPDEGTRCIMRSNSGAMCSHTPWHLGWGAFMSGIDAAVLRRDTGKLYLFSGPQYIRYSDVDLGIDDGYPKPIAGNWPGLPESFSGGIDAALWRNDNDALYFFKGDQYVRFSRVSDGVDVGYPRSIAGNWPDLPSSFLSGIDAAFWRKSNDKLYMFRGNQYLRMSDVSTGVDTGYPRAIQGNWQGVHGDFSDGMDAALMRTENDKIYFFKGTRYLRFSDVRQSVDSGYPKFVDDGWLPFPRTIPRSMT